MKSSFKIRDIESRSAQEEKVPSTGVTGVERLARASYESIRAGMFAKGILWAIPEGKVISSLSEFDPDFELKEDDFIGYEEYSKDIRYAGSQDQLNQIKGLIDNHKLNQRIIQEGGWYTTPAVYASSIASEMPVFMMLGSITRATKLGSYFARMMPFGGNMLKGLVPELAKNMAKHAAGSTLVTAPYEFIAHAIDEHRTIEDSLKNMTFGAMLGAGVMGSIATYGKLKAIRGKAIRSRAYKKAYEKAESEYRFKTAKPVEAEVVGEEVVEPVKEPDLNEKAFDILPEESTADYYNVKMQESGSFEVRGVAEYREGKPIFVPVEEVQKVLLGGKPIADSNAFINSNIVIEQSEAYGFENVPLNPMQNAMNSHLPAYRRGMLVLSENSTLLEINDMGIATPTSINNIADTLIKTYSAKAHRGLNKGWEDIDKSKFNAFLREHFGFDADPHKVFRDEVGKAMRNFGKHDDPIISQTAKDLIKDKTEIVNKAMAADTWGIKEKTVTRLQRKIEKTNKEIDVISEKQETETRELKKTEREHSYTIEKAQRAEKILQDKIDIKQPTREQLISYGKAEAKIRDKIKASTKEEAELMSKLEKGLAKSEDVTEIEKKIEANKAAREKITSEWKEARKGKTYKPTSKATALAHERVGKINEDIKSTKKRIVSLGKLKKTKATEKKLKLENKKLSNLESKGLKEQLKLEEKLPTKENLKTYFSSREQRKLLLDEQKQLKSELRDLTLTEKQRNRLTDRLKSNTNDLEEAINKFNEAKKKVDIEKVSKGAYVRYGRAVEGRVRAEHTKKLATSKIESYEKRKGEMALRRELKIEQLNEELQYEQNRTYTEADFSDEGFGESHFFTLWDRALITNNQVEFRTDALEAVIKSNKMIVESKVAKLVEKGEHPKTISEFKEKGIFDVDTAKDIVEQFIMNIDGTTNGRLTEMTIVVSRGPFKGRTFRVPSRLLEKWKFNDAGVVLEKSYNTMIMDTILKEGIGDTTGQKLLELIEKDYKALRAVAKDSKELKELDKEFKDAQKNVTAVVNRLRGLDKINSSSLIYNDTIIESMVDTGKNINTARYLGKIAFGSLGDTGTAVMTVGFRRFFGASLKMLSDRKLYKEISRDFANDISIGAQIYTRRGGSVNDMITQDGFLGMAQKTSKWAAGKLMLLSYIHHWDNMIGTIASYAGSARALRAMQTLANGKKISKADSRFLNTFGLPKKYHQMILEQFKAHGKMENGVYQPSVHKWTDLDAQIAFRSFINKVQDTSVIKPKAADYPLIFDSLAGGFFLQFKRFGFAAWQKITIAGLQRKDLAVFAGLLTTIVASMMGETAKALLSGRDLDMEEIFHRAIQRCDFAGIMPDMYDLVEATFGSYEERNNATNDIRNALGGAGVSLLTDAAKASQVLNPFTKTKRTHVRSLRKLFGFQNLPLAEQIFDQIEDKAHSFFGTTGRIYKKKGKSTNWIR